MIGVKANSHVLMSLWLCLGPSAAATAAEAEPLLEQSASMTEADRDGFARPPEAVAGVTAAGLTGPSGKKWLAAGEDEPEATFPLAKCLFLFSQGAKRHQVPVLCQAFKGLLPLKLRECS